MDQQKLSAIEAKHARAIARFKRQLEKCEEARQETADQLDRVDGERRELMQEASQHVETINQLELTLAERQTYIQGLEQTVNSRETEIGLLRLEIEYLTAWRQKELQIRKTEAEIEAARSALAQSKNPQQVMESLSYGKKDSR